MFFSKINLDNEYLVTRKWHNMKTFYTSKLSILYFNYRFGFNIKLWFLSIKFPYSLLMKERTSQIQGNIMRIQVHQKRRKFIYRFHFSYLPQLRPRKLENSKAQKKVAAGSRIPAWDTVRAVLLSLLNFRKSAVILGGNRSAGSVLLCSQEIPSVYASRFIAKTRSMTQDTFLIGQHTQLTLFAFLAQNKIVRIDRSTEECQCPRTVRLENSEERKCTGEFSFLFFSALLSSGLLPQGSSPTFPWGGEGIILDASEAFGTAVLNCFRSSSSPR
uniref:Uncharacterized protein n=1 Tax=Heterorhabditis bacteriophora TaxID=37862 RepID=A0A1I7WM62_HETBA